jgi:hypothetical protein
MKSTNNDIGNLMQEQKIKTYEKQAFELWRRKPLFIIGIIADGVGIFLLFLCWLLEDDSLDLFFLSATLLLFVFGMFSVIKQNKFVKKYVQDKMAEEKLS